MKRLLASLLASVGVAGAAQPQPKIQTIDPKTILFTTPTLSNDIAGLEPVDKQPSDGDFIFHEDEWSQVEFFPKAQLPEVQRVLTEYKPFEQKHRVQHGWRGVYVRKVQRVPVISGSEAVRHIERSLGAKAGPAPILFSASTVSGRVKNGFSVPLGGNVTLYGYTEGQGVPVLGAIVGRSADDAKLTQAFVKLNASNGLILVDWRAQLVLLSVDPSGQIQVWRP
jgi:hypothetical protein